MDYPAYDSQQSQPKSDIQSFDEQVKQESQQERPATADKKLQQRKKSSYIHRLSGGLQIQTEGHDASSDVGSSSNNSPWLPVDLGAMLRQNSLFSSVTALQDLGVDIEMFIDEIAKQMHMRHFQVGDVVIKEGDVGKAMFLVLRGWVTVASKDGELIYADLGQGKFFGEISLLFDMPRTANVIAKTKCLLAVLTQTDLQFIMKQFPEVCDEMRVEAEDRLNKLMAKKQQKAVMPSLPIESQSFQQVPSEVMDQIQNVQTVQQGFVFYNQGELVQNPILYVIKTGSVSLMNSDMSHIYTVLNQGCFFGESVVCHHLIDSKPNSLHTETSVALQDSQIGMLSVSQLRQFVQIEQFRQNMIRSSLRSQAWYYLMLRRKSGSNVITRIPTSASFKVASEQPAELNINIQSIKSSDSFGSINTSDKSLMKIKMVSAVPVTGDVSAGDTKPETLANGKVSNSSENLKAQPNKLFRQSSKSSTSLLNNGSGSMASLSLEVNSPSLKRNSTWKLTEQSDQQHDDVVSDLLNGSGGNSQVPQALSPWSKLKDPNFLLAALDQVASSSGELSEVSRVTEEEELRQSEEQEYLEELNGVIEPVASIRSPVSPKSRLSTLANSVDPKKRRASIAVWTDQKLTDMSNNKSTQPNSPKPSLSAKNRYANVFSPQSTVESDSESDDSDAEETHPLKNAVIVGCILKFLPFRDTWKLRTVCHKWKHIIHRSSDIIKKIDLSDYSKYVDDRVLDNIAQHVNINLEVLILRNCWKITNNSMKSLAQNCRQLSILDLCGCWEVNDEGLMSLSLGCRFIRSIDLSNCRKINDGGMLSLFQNCNQLQDVYVSYCKALSDAVLGFIQTMAPNIRRLNFQRCLGITDQGITIMAGGLTEYQMRYTKLQEILLSDCSFLTDSAMEDVSMMCPNLKILNVSFCCALTEVSWQYLTEGCKRMRILDASFCGGSVTDDSLQLMSKQWPELMALSIRGCNKVTNQGLLHLYANSLNLTKVNVTSCKNIDIDTLGATSQSGGQWQFLGAQVPVVDSAGISGTSEALGSTHIRRFTAP